MAFTALDYLSPLCFALTLEPSSYLHSSCNWAICSHVDLNMASSFSFQSLRILFDTLPFWNGGPQIVWSLMSSSRFPWKKKKKENKKQTKNYISSDILSWQLNKLKHHHQLTLVILYYMAFFYFLYHISMKLYCLSPF